MNGLFLYHHADNKELILSNADFHLLHDKEKTYDSHLASTCPFPSDYVLALFAQLAYKDETDILKKLDDRKGLENWKFLAKAKNNQFLDCYEGVAFWNPKLHHVVVAHKGTDPKFKTAVANYDYINDAQLALKEPEIYKSASAASFVYLIIDEIKKVNELDGPKIRLSITGHSLGAWLAQYTTFTAKFLNVVNIIENGTEKMWFVKDENYVNNLHPHTVVFESPGCMENLAALRELLVDPLSQEKFGDYRSLDMTVYLNKLNYINRVNQQVGRIYLIENVSSHSIKAIINEFDKHGDGDGDVQKVVLLNFNTGLKKSMLEWGKNKFSIQSNPKDMKTKKFEKNVESLNIFSENELEYVRTLSTIITSYPKEETQILDIVELFAFKIIYEENVIKSENLTKFVAKIKHCSPTTSLLYDKLKNCLKEQQFLEIKSMSFKEELFDFQNYSFKVYDRQDKLKEFLKSNDRILHVHCNEDSDCRIELSILYNILSKLYTGNFYFLKWKDILSISKGSNIQDVGLTVLDCRGAEANEQILNVLKEVSEEVFKKFVILSRNSFNLTDEKNIKKVDACSLNIQLDFLDEPSQNKFLNHKYFKTTVQMSLNDICSCSNWNLPTSMFIKLLTQSNETVINLDDLNANLPTSFLFHSLSLTINRPKNLKLEKHGLYMNEIDNRNKQNTHIYLNKTEEFEELCLQKWDKHFYLYENGNDGIRLLKIFSQDFYIKREVIFSSSIYNNFNDCDDKNDLICENNIEPELNKKMQNLDVQNNDVFDIFKNDKIVMISGISGIGKSSIVDYLYLKLKTKYWIFVIHLNNVDLELLQSLSLNITLDEAASIIISREHEIYPILKHCLNHKVKSKLPICLMFDAFDDLEEQISRNNFISLINFLTKLQVNILITTKPHLRNELQQSITGRMTSFDLKRLDNPEYVKDFFLQFLNCQSKLYNSFNDTKQLKKVFQHILNSEISNILYIPSCLRQISEEIIPPFAMSEERNLCNILNLYEMLFNYHITRYLKKIGMNINSKKRLNSFRKVILSDLKYVALNKLLKTDIQNLDIQNLYDVGLIYSESNEQDLKFIDDSFCDFIISKCLHHWLTTPNHHIHGPSDIEDIFVSDIFCRQHKLLRRFLNLQLTTLSNDVKLERVHSCAEKLKAIVENDPIYYESIIELCKQENLHAILNKFLYKIRESLLGIEI